MWADFSDFELATLAHQYGIEDSLIWCGDFSLYNRNEIESLLTQIEYDDAFLLDNKSEPAYN
jgi:hypothetical protein